MKHDVNIAFGSPSITVGPAPPSITIGPPRMTDERLAEIKAQLDNLEWADSPAWRYVAECFCEIERLKRDIDELKSEIDRSMREYIEDEDQ
jgi:hypothetical protein